MNDMSRREILRTTIAAGALAVPLAAGVSPALAQPLAPEKTGKDDNARRRAVIAIYPYCTFLDFIGPYTALQGHFDVDFVWLSRDPIPDDSSIAYFVPTKTTREITEPFDVLLVSGSGFAVPALRNIEYIQEIQRLGGLAQYVTSVCSGSLILGAAGLLKGYRATSHWQVRDLLSLVGAIPVDARVVRDRNRITAGGVTSGIDFGLELIMELFGKEAAMETQLTMEYDPHPPVDAGTPHKAPAELTARANARYANIHEELSAALREIPQ